MYNPDEDLLKSPRYPVSINRSRTDQKVWC